MPSLDDAALDAPERGVLERAVERLRDELGTDLHGVWLYGSRARGERTGPESDIDVLVVSSGEALRRISDLVDEVASELRVDPGWFSVHVVTPEHVTRRREIESFFMREVDRDKIVLYGEP